MNPKKYQASTTILAPAALVWQILTEAKGYPAWDKTMDRIEGKLALGEKVTFFTKLSPQAFPVRVTGWEVNRKLVLTGGMPFGLFKSERTHSLTPTSEGQTKFFTEEVFRGWLLPVFGKNIPDLTENFQGFVAALKAEAEKRRV